MIIDCHIHVGKSNWFHIDTTIDDILRAADRAGIEKLMVTHFTALLYDIREGNAEMRTIASAHRDRVFPYYTVSSPRNGSWIADDLTRYVEEYGFRGLKIYSVPPLMVIDDPYMMPIIERAAVLRIPVLAHSNAQECEAILSRIPDLLLINAHMGCCPQAYGDWHLSIATAKKFSNMYLDTTSSSFDTGMIELAVREVGADRVLYGSDTPILDPGLQILKVRESQISEDAKELILHKNIERLLSHRGSV